MSEISSQKSVPNQSGRSLLCLLNEKFLREKYRVLSLLKRPKSMSPFHSNRFIVFTSGLLVGAIGFTSIKPAVAWQSEPSSSQIASLQANQSSRTLIATAYTNATLPTLRRGDQGQSVRMLRQILTDNGFMSAAASRMRLPQSYPFISNDYDLVVEDAIKDLQRRYNLPADGVVGPTTWEVLDRQENPYRSPLPWQQATAPTAVRPPAPTAVRPPAPTSGRFREAFVSVQEGSLNVRRSPWGDVVNSLPNGARVLVTNNRDGDWVQLNNGTWLREQYIRYSGRTN